MKRVFVSDCEGPISKNDNAFELADRFVPEGGKLFSLISKYDDILADVVKREGYNAGDTLKLVLPFFKAYGLTDKKMSDFSAGNLLLIAGTRETLSHIQGLTDTYIVSTSYEHYIKALCDYVGFPFENTYCTKLCLDKFELDSQEKGRLLSIAEEISAMTLMSIPPGAKSLDEFSEKDRETVKRLDEIFWEEIEGMKCGKLFSEVKTVGGEQKAEAIRDVAKRFCVDLSGVIYVGDSITDVQAFQLVRGGGGLTVSFNGNEYAVKNAEVAVQAENNMVTAVIANVFLLSGKENTISLINNWTAENLRKSVIDKALVNRFLDLFSNGLPKVQIVTSKNMELLSKESSQFRKKVRGEAVGKLG